MEVGGGELNPLLFHPHCEHWLAGYISGPAPSLLQHFPDPPDLELLPQLPWVGLQQLSTEEDTTNLYNEKRVITYITHLA